MNYIRRETGFNLLAMEYPGYGINWDWGLCTADLIMSDAKSMLKFVNNQLNIQNQDIIIVGRSMGTGVAC